MSCIHERHYHWTWLYECVEFGRFETFHQEPYRSLLLVPIGNSCTYVLGAANSYDYDHEKSLQPVACLFSFLHFPKDQNTSISLDINIDTAIIRICFVRCMKRLKMAKGNDIGWRSSNHLLMAQVQLVIGKNPKNPTKCLFRRAKSCVIEFVTINNKRHPKTKINTAEPNSTYAR